MKRTYKTNQSKIEVIRSLRSLVDHEGETGIKDHFRYIFNSKYREVLMGNFDSDPYRIWPLYTTNLSRGVRLNIFYPIIKIKLLNQSETHLTFSQQMNPFGLIISLLYVAVLAYIVITGIVVQENMDTNFVINRSLVALMVMAVFTAPLILVYNSTARKLRNEILKKIAD